ncbi:DinB family protein [mine drainage metagenome]|uniref:DinB family protein n=1 Tax=mine drainage metagenome TaxID=410659 RepID=A0A1J5SZR3_9ZZZZ
MTFIESFSKELEKEANTTRKMLSRVPDTKFSWKPHEKSMSLVQLATHVAEIPSWLGMVLNTSELDFANNSYNPAVINNSKELMDHFEKSLIDGRENLAKGNDKQLLEETWTMRSGDKIFSTETKLEVLRGCFCQIVHHRAQLGVYLRLLDIPIPGSYGPSADEQNF